MRQFNATFFRDLWKLSRPYWSVSEERWSARGLFALVIGLNLVTVVVAYRVTEWYRTFWDALQHYDAREAFHELGVFVLLVTPYIVAAVYQTYVTQLLEIRWRRWLTREYVEHWLARSTYYQMQVFGDGTDNPDQRIAEDLDAFTRQTLDLIVAVVSSLTTIVAFLSMLWTLSSQVPITVHHTRIYVAGYLVWAAVVYSLLGTIVTALIGRPLIRLNFDQERLQADFRFGLARLREHTESVALYGGEAKERESFLGRFAKLFGNFVKIVVRTKRLNWWVNGYGQAAVIFPVLVSLPAYFARAIQIGTIMQISSAFTQVQGALSLIVTSYTGLAGWHAVVDRLRFFEQSMRRLKEIREAHDRIARRDGPTLRVAHLDVALPSGHELVHHLELEVGRGSRLVVMGPSGVGKSTLLRALAGIWPYGEGEVELPARSALLFLPQRPYLPLGTLRDVLLYPHGLESTSDDELRRVLEQAGLPALGAMLGEDRDWAHVLSLGEQQRLAFGRTLLQRPGLLFLDEATSALDEPAEADLYRTLLEALPSTGVVSVGHRSTLSAFHERRLVLLGGGEWRVEPIVPARPGS